MDKIMFNNRFGQTQAVIDEIKTNTRRAERSLDILPLFYNPLITEFQFEYSDGLIVVRRLFKGTHVQTYHLKPRYKIGDEVAVAQAYKNDDVLSFNAYDNVGAYHLDGLKRHKEMLSSPGYRNKMFVKAEYMPHRIRITNIKVERLQDISDVDAIKEGIYDANDFMNPGAYTYFGSTNTYKTPHEAFAALIDRISGRGTWERNPWVFAYEFKLIKK